MDYSTDVSKRKTRFSGVKGSHRVKDTGKFNFGNSVDDAKMELPFYTNEKSTNESYLPTQRLNHADCIEYLRSRFLDLQTQTRTEERRQ